VKRRPSGKDKVREGRQKKPQMTQIDATEIVVFTGKREIKWQQSPTPRQDSVEDMFSFSGNRGSGEST